MAAIIAMRSLIICKNNPIAFNSINEINWNYWNDYKEVVLNIFICNIRISYVIIENVRIYIYINIHIV